MTLRVKLVLAQLPLAIALVLVAIVSTLAVDALGDTSRRILSDNYRSVLAAQRMKESVERLDSAALFRIAGDPAKADSLVDEHRPAFERELVAQEQNVTEAGEDVTTVRLRAAWHDYLAAYDTFVGAPTAGQYFAELEPRFILVKETANTILTLNQDAMVRKSDAAHERGIEATRVVSLSSLAAVIVGLLASLAITARLLRPLDNLALVARRLGDGELSVRANVMGRDEIAGVAREFNEMATRLEAFRKSSLGDLLRAQLASQAAIDSIPDPVVVFGITGGVLSSNHSADAVLRLDAADPTRSATESGNPLAMVDPPLRAALEHARDHVLAGKGPYAPKGFEDAVATHGAEGERWYLVRATPLYSERSGVAGVTVIVQDVSRLRRFDELRNNMMATVAHELRTPLTSLRMAIHLCVEGAAGELTDKQLDLLAAGRDDCQRLQSIVDDLLDLTRLQAGRIELERELVSPQSLVDRCIDNHRADADRREVQLVTRVTPSLDPIAVDPGRIGLVFDNLVGNALRHCPPRSTVTIVAEPADDRVIFRVIDDGPGIPAQHLPRLFDRFFRIRDDAAAGAGLGLSIAREVVQAHGGEIGVTSEAGHGAAFWFTIPHTS